MKVVEGGQAKTRPSQHLYAPTVRVVEEDGVTTVKRVTVKGAIDDEADTDLAGRWVYTLNKDDKEVIAKNSGHNRIVACRYHPDMIGCLAWDEFSAEVVLLKRPAWEPDTGPWRPRAMVDNDARLCAAWMEHKLKFKAEANNAGPAMITAATASPFNPVKDFLETLQWDGLPRVQGDPHLDPWLTEYMGARHIPINRAFGMRWLISAVARAYEPGCKVDTMLILEGKQGALKSSALKILGTLNGRSFFTDGVSEVGSKDASLVMNGVWIAEIAELDALRKSEASAIKAWLSRSTDRFRPPYGKIPVNLARRSVLAGTVNPSGTGYLKDTTGSRRFWPVAVKKIDKDRLERDRDQIWAEAVHLYKSGEPWWLQGEEEGQAAAVQKLRQEQEPWGEAIDKYAENMESVTTEGVMEMLGLARVHQTPTALGRIVDHLKAAGWKRTQRRIEGRPRKCYVRDDPTDD